MTLGRMLQRVRIIKKPRYASQVPSIIAFDAHHPVETDVIYMKSSPVYEDWILSMERVTVLMFAVHFSEGEDSWGHFYLTNSVSWQRSIPFPKDMSP